MTAPELTSRASAAGVLGRLSASRASAAYLVGAAAATGLYFLLPPDVQSVWFVLVGLSAAIAVYLGARVNLASDRLPWLLFAGGILCQVAGDAIFAVYEIRLDREPAVPSVAD